MQLSVAIAHFPHAPQVQDNTKAAPVHLSADELAEIDAIGTIVTDHLDDNPILWDCN